MLKLKMRIKKKNGNEVDQRRQWFGGDDNGVAKKLLFVYETLLKYLPFVAGSYKNILQNTAKKS